MKKILYSIMALAIAAMTFTACEDVPEPYPIPTPDGGGTEYTYEGNGTLESPYTCADAIHYAKSLGQAESENEVYVKGFITSITDEFSAQHGTASFVMSDTKNGSNKFTFWRCLYLGNKKFTSGDTQIKVGDEVIIYGKVVNYKGNTPETVQGAAFLYSLNGVTNSGGSEEPVAEAKGSGTLEDPFNAAAAIAYAKEIGEKESDKEVYIKGKVSSITEQYGTEYGNGSFSISDDGEPVGEFYVHRALYLGNQKYTTGDLLKKYDEVIVCGKVYNYKGNTPETVQAKAYLYSLNGKTEAGGGQEGGGEVSGNSITVAASSFNLENQTKPTTLTLPDDAMVFFVVTAMKSPSAYAPHSLPVVVMSMVYVPPSAGTLMASCEAVIVMAAGVSSSSSPPPQPVKATARESKHVRIMYRFIGYLTSFKIILLILTCVSAGEPPKSKNRRRTSASFPSFRVAFLSV